MVDKQPIEIVNTSFNISKDSMDIKMVVTFKINDTSITMEEFKKFLDIFKNELAHELQEKHELEKLKESMKAIDYYYQWYQKEYNGQHNCKDVEKDIRAILEISKKSLE